MLYTILNIILLLIVTYSPLHSSQAIANTLQSDISVITNNSQNYLLSQFNSSKSELTESKLLYFVSFSMPNPLIKSYLNEASKVGGSLVLRGIDPHSNLHDFLISKIVPLVKESNNNISILIDPRLFSYFDISIVPTIVFAPELNNLHLVEKNSVDRYWKLSGSVTTPWALEVFQSKGAPTQEFLQRYNLNNSKVNVD
jgi:type-F conjugative transfer system pilin assembly protein TrbC